MEHLTQRVKIKGIEDLLFVAANWFDTSLLDLQSKGRKNEVVMIRQIVSYLSTDVIKAGSLKFVGTHLGGRDHTTIIHGRNAVRNAIAAPTSNKPLYDLYNQFISHCDFKDSKTKVILLTIEQFFDAIHTYNVTEGDIEEKRKAVLDIV